VRQYTLAWRCQHMPTLLPALCSLFVSRYCIIGVLHLLLCPARCSWIGPQKTAHQPAVTVIGNMSWETACRTVALSGLQKSTLHNNQPWVLCPPLELRVPPLGFARPPLEVVWRGMRRSECVSYFTALLLLLHSPLLPLSW
jgi:hypothetical protein